MEWIDQCQGRVEDSARSIDPREALSTWLDGDVEVKVV